MRRLLLPVPSWWWLVVVFGSAVNGATQPVESSSDAMPAAAEPWSLADVEVKPSAKITWGALANGLRYAIMPHSSPAERVSMRLYVRAGSIHEREEERGYAHFVEHMAFNGTQHFPAGELLKHLQRLGATSQTHNNADTSHTRTLYKLELPDNSPASLETGFRIFRDYADGILFQPVEVRRERGVILSEEQFRRTPAEAVRIALTDLLYAGTRIADRQPIGLISRIEEASAKSLRAFYDAWYRPENMCVVVVGQIDRLACEEMLRAAFASLVGRGPAFAIPDVGAIAATSEPIVRTHAEDVGGFHISLFKLFPRSPERLTWGAQLESHQIRIGFSMLARRLQLLTQASPQVINDSSTSLDLEFGLFRRLSVKVSSSPENWGKALGIAEQEVRRVIEHGFGRDELAYQQTMFRQSVRSMAASFPTIASTDVADAIVESLEVEQPIVFIDEALDDMLSMIDQLSVEDCQRTFRKYWGNDAPRIFITTTANHIQSVDAVRASFAASRKIPVAPAVLPGETVFAYEDFGPSGAVAEKKHLPDLDVWLVRFANDVRLNIKRTPFEFGLARFKVHIGNGEISEPPAKPGLRFWIGTWWLGGVGKHTAAELGGLVGGLESVATGSQQDAFTITGYTRTENLPRTLKQLTAMMVDPAFRSEGHEAMASHLRGMFNPMWVKPEGPVQRFVLPSLASDDPRIGIPDPEVILAHTSDDLRAWLQPQLENGPIEIAVVGDVDVDTVIAEMAKTFGTLRVRQPKIIPESLRKLQIPKRVTSSYYYYGGGEDRPSTLEFFWPIRVRPSVANKHRLAMLALVFEDRVRQHVRERKAATYAPRASFSSSEVYSGFGFLRCALEVSAEDAVKYGDVVRDLADKLAKAGVKADELVRVKAQSLAELKSALSRNEYWLEKLSAAQEKPEILDAVRTTADDIAQTSTAHLDALARSYLRADQGFRYIIEPSARMPKQASK